MSSELRPCPICHKPAKGEASVCDYIILCRPCGLRMRRNSEHRDVAVAAWNRRVPSPAVKALVEACRDVLKEGRPLRADIVWALEAVEREIGGA